MSKRYDITGQRFGRLVAIREEGTNSAGSIRWRVQCDCGKQALVIGYNLRKGITTSCGCLRTEILTQHNDKLKNLATPLEKHYKDYIAAAKTRNLDFTLSIEEFQQLISKECYYCGKQPSQLYSVPNGNYYYNGIDRYNNDIGYVQDNVVPCCVECNYFKRVMNGDDFIRLIRKIYNHTKSR